MADNTFSIKITAVDNATKVVNKVNKAVSTIFRPYDNAKKSTKSFFDALGRNELLSRPLAGMQKLGGAIGSISSSFGIAENSVMSGAARIAASLGSVGGPLGAIAGGAVIAGGAIVGVTAKMGALGLDVARTSKSLGITTDQLQEYRGAAKQAGLSTESMDSSLSSLSATLQDASAGRNLQAATLLSQMGVTIKRNKDGVVDTVAAYRDISDVISKIADPNIQKKMADMLGMSEMLPLIREGNKALDGYIDSAHKLGLVQSKEVVEANEKAGQSWNRLKASVDGMGTSLGNLLSSSSLLNTVTSGMASSAERLTKGMTSKGGMPFMGGIISPDEVSKYGNLGKAMTAEPAVKSMGSRSVSGKITDSTGSAVVDSAGMGARGIRTNNPGNLRSWPGAGSSGGYATFASPEDGLKAAGRNLIGYQDKYGINTISKIINRWAPAGDGNNVPAYVSAMSKQTGYGADQPLDLHDPKVLAPLISAITKHENGQNPYDADTIAKAAVAAVREAQGGSDGGSDKGINLVVHNVPSGMTIKAVRGLGQSTVGLTMAPGGAS